MSSYRFNDNTLLHSVGFDFSKFCNILDKGIMSFNYAKNQDVFINKNYEGYNLEDTISCVRYLYVTSDDSYSAYNKYVKKGISFIIEDMPFIYDKNERIIHRSDEVLVKDYIPLEKIKGVLVPEEYMDIGLTDLEYIRDNATSFVLIKNNLTSLKDFLKGKGLNVNNTYYEDIIRELYAINEAYRVETSREEKELLMEDFKTVIDDLNYLIGEDMNKCFSRILGKDGVTLREVINYLNKDLPIYEIPKTLKNVRK